MIAYRKHQVDLEKLLTLASPQRLLEQKLIVPYVTPGGGKSALPVMASHILQRRGVIGSVVWVVPRLSLRKQAAKAFTDQGWRDALGHRLEIREAGNDYDPARGAFGYVTTYDAIRADSTGIHRNHLRSRNCLLVLDEVHHVAVDSPTHNALKPLYDLAPIVLGMTGSLDRNEGDRIAFLDYDSPNGDGRLFPDTHITYGLRDAIRERALIRSEWKHLDGEGAYYDAKGQKQKFLTLGGEESADRSALYAALKSEYARGLLHLCLQHWRRWHDSHPRSRMLVVCASKAQAKQAAKWLEEFGVTSYAIATSDDSDAAQTVLTMYREQGTPDIIITVQMAYEGFDAPAITHLACLTHIRSFQWLDQMFGRATRFDRYAGPWESQWAFFFVPDDPDMEAAIRYRKGEEKLGVSDASGDPSEGDGDQDGKLDDSSQPNDPPTCIAPINSEVTSIRASGCAPGEAIGSEHTARLQALIDRHGLNTSVISFAGALAELGVNLDTLPPAPAPSPSRQPATVAERELKLKQSIQRLASRMDHYTGMDHGAWNQRLFHGPQRQQSREDMSEARLLEVWRWLCQQAASVGLPDPGAE